MTYGEAWVEWKLNMNGWDYSFDKCPPMRVHDPRMNRDDALEYYKRKLRKVFGLDEFDVKDFDSVEDYFDYYEAKKIKDKRR